MARFFRRILIAFTSLLFLVLFVFVWFNNQVMALATMILSFVGIAALGYLLYLDQHDSFSLRMYETSSEDLKEIFIGNEKEHNRVIQLACSYFNVPVFNYYTQNDTGPYELVDNVLKPMFPQLPTIVLSERYASVFYRNKETLFPRMTYSSFHSFVNTLKSKEVVTPFTGKMADQIVGDYTSVTNRDSFLEWVQGKEKSSFYCITDHGVIDVNQLLNKVHPSALYVMLKRDMENYDEDLRGACVLNNIYCGLING